MIAAVAGLALLAGARAVRPAPDRAGLDLAPAPPEAKPAENAARGQESAREALDGVLDTLGAAHHRPFSRG